MTKDKALEMALEFIERVNQDGWILADFEPQMYATITAIKEALAQPEQINTRPCFTIGELNVWADEKQAWHYAAIRLGEELSSVGPVDYYNMSAKEWFDWAMAQEPQGKNSLAQSEQGGKHDTR